jgi:hypothetical protein
LEAFGGPDDLGHTLAPPGDAAIAEDAELAVVGRLRRFERMKDRGIDAARGAANRDPVATLQAAADALGIAQEQEAGAAGRRPFELVALQDEIEVAKPGGDAAELVQDGELAAHGGVEALLAQGGEGPGFGLEIEPGGLVAGGMVEDEAVAAGGQGVAQLEIAAHAAEDVDVRQEGGDPEGAHAAHFIISAGCPPPPSGIVDNRGPEKYTMTRFRGPEALSDGEVAQLVERGTENPCVGGSIPSLAIPPFSPLENQESVGSHRYSGQFIERGPNAPIG